MDRISSASSQRSNKAGTAKTPKVVLVTGGNGFLGNEYFYLNMNCREGLYG